MLRNYKNNAKQRKRATAFMALAWLLCMFLISPPASAQGDVRINLQKKDITVVSALKEVERQSGLSVGYNDSALESSPAITLNLTDARLPEALNAILGGTGFTYEIKDRYIKIVPKPQDNRPRSRTITGQVLDERQETLIGASVTVEGTDVGAITDIDGRFSIEASTGNVLRFTYLGYQPASVKVTEKAVYNIQLTGDVDVLSEVVVTALGIRREQKALSYNVQQVKSEQLLAVKDANFINSLGGKVAGVTINSSSAGVGGASKVVMRGVKSIEQSSNALYVIDGVPMYNFGG